jgi:hypothetical protein
VVLYTRRDDTIRALLYPRESCVFNASVVLVQPVVVCGGDFVSVAIRCNSVYCCSVVGLFVYWVIHV